MFDWEALGRHVRDLGEDGFRPRRPRALSGGSINAAYAVEGEGRTYFVKLNTPQGAGMFAAEAEGLRELAAAEAFRVPAVIAHGVCAGRSFLVLEYLELSARGDERLLGRQLAGLHRKQWAQYGWWRDNTIGSTPQINTPEDDWITFWREHRLGFQLRLAVRNGHGGAWVGRGERLLDGLPALIGHRPPASLLHGDLWSGNYAFTPSGEGVIFDPAVYYGDREADLAMTELFGGFGADFYAAYRDHYPLDDGYRVRKTLYNLYHILNHLNLFGGYRGQAERMIGQLLAEIE